MSGEKLELLPGPLLKEKTKTVSLHCHYVALIYVIALEHVIHLCTQAYLDFRTVHSPGRLLRGVQSNATVYPNATENGLHSLRITRLGFAQHKLEEIRFLNDAGIKQGKQPATNAVVSPHNRHDLIQSDASNKTGGARYNHQHQKRPGSTSDGGIVTSPQHAYFRVRFVYLSYLPLLS